MLIMEGFKTLMRKNAHCCEMIKAETEGISDNNKGMLITSKEPGGRADGVAAVCHLVIGADLVPLIPAQMCLPTDSKSS